MKKEQKIKTIEQEQTQHDKVKKYMILPLYRKIFSVFTLSKSDRQLISQLNKQAKEEIETKNKNFNKENIFEIKHYNLWYNRVNQVLFDINLNIKRNKVTAFIGASGCGKSTLLRSLNRMNNLYLSLRTSGDIYFDDGTNLKSKDLSHIELTTRVGMIFQKYSPFPMSIYENIAYGPKSHGIVDKNVIDKIVYEALVDAALWDEVKHKLNEPAIRLSGGQQQRLCIARAVALHPEVLLMDEPTSGLDPIATSKIENLVNKLKQKYTIVIVTHSMDQAQRVSDETVFFHKGKIIEHNTTKKIFTAPQQKLTKNYILGKNQQ